MKARIRAWSSNSLRNIAVARRAAWHTLTGAVTAGALIALIGSGCGDETATGDPIALSPADGGESAASGGAEVANKVIQACEAPVLKAYAAVITPQGLNVGYNTVEIAGVVIATGATAPPTSECGTDQAWVKIKQDGTNASWIGCFRAPGLQLGLVTGDHAELSHRVDTFAFTASTHITLRKAGALVAHVEWTVVEDDASLPDGITLARGVDEFCRMPNNPCKVRSYGATFGRNGTLISLKPGEEGTLGAYRVYLDRYWLETASSACDGGDSNIVVAVTPISPP